MGLAACTVLLFSVLACECSGIKIAMMPQFGRSHYLVMSKLAEELASRGHKASVYVGEEADYAIGKPNVKAFHVPQGLRESFLGNLRAIASSKGTTSANEEFEGLVSLQKIYCDSFLNSSSMMREVGTSDVLVGDSLYLCSTLVANKFNLTHIIINMGPLSTFTMLAFGIDTIPAYVPQLMSGLTRYMGLPERIKNLGFYFGSRFLMEWFIYPTYKLIKEKHGISPEKSVKESLSTVDLIIMPRDFILDHAQPIPPYGLPKDSVPPNVRAVKWLPQNDVLGHSKTKLFITHAGANGLAESAYHGVPMICVPIFGDQFDNSQLAKDIGIAEMIKVNDMTADQFVSTLQRVLTQGRFKESSARISKAMKRRLRAPVAEAADLVEYVQALGHVDHLKPRGFSMPIYQLYMLDVLAVLVVAFISIVAVVKITIGACKSISSNKNKTD
ncbi:UDP-glucuronosyltransferase 2A1 isoform X2 [Nematostella vectensis]|uniref:UDP-glucuronosyltransferase 2A1 isoform X2 n=1 Tax=Nematostella vectensis TaxID=45351 RepID=UPI0020771A46|nr:UDP-glucuronosyltransferase 2A1 isoform X2 [Nematostella vectensis]